MFSELKFHFRFILAKHVQTEQRLLRVDRSKATINKVISRLTRNQNSWKKPEDHYALFSHFIWCFFQEQHHPSQHSQACLYELTAQLRGEDGQNGSKIQVVFYGLHIAVHFFALRISLGRTRFVIVTCRNKIPDALIHVVCNFFGVFFGIKVYLHQRDFYEYCLFKVGGDNWGMPPPPEPPAMYSTHVNFQFSLELKINKRILNLQSSYETQGKTAESMLAQYGIIARPERDKNSRNQSTAVNWIN